ncbi:hypothetical protein HK098_007679 [Nowakowskiella sp. JEL0407]|nr:hypothetical protein HK098_007679 [Nowakowskiella sp. JEL0407]
MNTDKWSEQIAIEDLAADVSSRQRHRTKRSCSVPFAVVMLFFTLVVFSSAIIPTCIIVFTAANSATNDLSAKIVNSVVINLSSQVEAMFQSVKTSTDVFTQNEFVRQMMSNRSTGYSLNDDVNKAALVTLKSNPMVERITCVQRFNLTGNAPPLVPPATGKFYTLQSWFFQRYGVNPNSFGVSYCDYGNNTNCFILNYDPQKKAVDQKPDVDAQGDPATTQYGSITLKLNSCSSETWKPEVFFIYGLITYARCGIGADGKVSTTAPYSCGAAFTTEYVLTQIFAKAAPTENSRVFLVSNAGRIITTNLNATVYPVIANGTNPGEKDYIKTSDFSEPIIRDIGSRISPNGDWSNVALSQSSSNIKVANASSDRPISKQLQLSDGNQWIVAVSKVNFGTPEDFYLVLGIPRNDFFGLVDGSIRTGITLSSVFTLMGVLIGIFVTLGILWPLRRLTNNMKLVTKFDFSMLSSGGLEEKSFFREIQVVQRTFNVMVKAFAGAIQRNRELASRKMGSSSANSNSGGFTPTTNGAGFASPNAPMNISSKKGYLGTGGLTNSPYSSPASMTASGFGSRY